MEGSRVKSYSHACFRHEIQRRVKRQSEDQPGWHDLPSCCVAPDWRELAAPAMRPFGIVLPSKRINPARVSAREIKLACSINRRVPSFSAHRMVFEFDRAPLVIWFRRPPPVTRRCARPPPIWPLKQPLPCCLQCQWPLDPQPQALAQSQLPKAACQSEPRWLRPG